MNLNKDYTDYRCVDPGTTTTDSSDKWFPMFDVCPCNPELSNPTGRGITACPFGISNNIPVDEKIPVSKLVNKNGLYVPESMTKQDLPFGSLFTPTNYIPPQLQPRPSSRIGLFWRS